MADLNALIAQGYQFQAPPDPFVQYGKRQQLELGEQTNQLNQMKMQEAQAAAVERNALRQLDPSSPDYENQLFKVNPTVGIAYRKEAATAAAQKATQEAQKAQALKTSLDNHRSFLVGVNDQPSYDAWRALTTKNIPELASMLPTAFSPDAKNLLLQTADDISKRLNPPAPAQSNLARLRAEKAALPLGDPGHAAYDAAIAKESQFAPPAPAAVSPLARLRAEKAALPLGDPGHAAYDAAIAKESQFAPTAPVAESPLAKLQREMAALPPNDPRRTEYAAMIRKETTHAPAAVVNIDQKQEGAFATGLGKGQSDRILANQVVAQDAAAILETNQVGRNLLKSGAITGTGADFFVGFNNALKQAGVDFGYADAAANSQAYAAAMGANVGRIIKQFGAGTGLSDADREYAAQMAGGKISLTETALRRILDINDKAANRVIDLHNKNVSGIKTNIPLTVEKPTFTPPPPSGASLIPGSTPAAAGGGATVTLPDGRIKTFPNADAANKFKKAAGL